MQSLMAPNVLAGARASYAAPNSRARLNCRNAMVTRRPNSGAMTTRAGKTPDGPKVAIAGISGAVGTEFMRVRVPVFARKTRLQGLVLARVPPTDRAIGVINWMGKKSKLATN